MSVRFITEQTELTELTAELQVRPDWHEPDEQGLTAKVYGGTFDNAGPWGTDETRYWGKREEQHVVLYRHGYPIAKVNLATLFAWAAAPRP